MRLTKCRLLQRVLPGMPRPEHLHFGEHAELQYKLTAARNAANKGAARRLLNRVRWLAGWLAGARSKTGWTCILHEGLVRFGKMSRPRRSSPHRSGWLPVIEKPLGHAGCLALSLSSRYSVSARCLGRVAVQIGAQIIDVFSAGSVILVPERRSMDLSYGYFVLSGDGPC